MQLTPQNSEEQAMLDIMEMRGFSWMVDSTNMPYLRTPDMNWYGIVLFENKSAIESAFATFQSLNDKYP
jgi:hypothetical protein